MVVFHRSRTQFPGQNIRSANLRNFGRYAKIFNTVLRTHVMSPTLAYSSLSLAESSSSVAACPRRISHHRTSA